MTRPSQLTSPLQTGALGAKATFLWVYKVLTAAALPGKLRHGWRFGSFLMFFFMMGWIAKSKHAAAKQQGAREVMRGGADPEWLKSTPTSSNNNGDGRYELGFVVIFIIGYIWAFAQGIMNFMAASYCAVWSDTLDKKDNPILAKQVKHPSKALSNYENCTNCKSNVCS